MWEHDLIKLYKGVTHGSSGGYTYTEVVTADRRLRRIMDENTKLREMALIWKKTGKKKSLNRSKQSFLDLDSREKQASVGGLAVACCWWAARFAGLA